MGHIPEVSDFERDSLQIDYGCTSGKFIDGRTTRTIHCTEMGTFSETDVSCDGKISFAL